MVYKYIKIYQMEYEINQNIILYILNQTGDQVFKPKILVWFSFPNPKKKKKTL